MFGQGIVYSLFFGFGAIEGQGRVDIAGMVADITDHIVKIDFEPFVRGFQHDQAIALLQHVERCAINRGIGAQVEAFDAHHGLAFGRPGKRKERQQGDGAQRGGGQTFRYCLSER